MSIQKVMSLNQLQKPAALRIGERIAGKKGEWKTCAFLMYMLKSRPPSPMRNMNMKVLPKICPGTLRRPLLGLPDAMISNVILTNNEIKHCQWRQSFFAKVPLYKLKATGQEKRK